jgi:hypothetical protein
MHFPNIGEIGRQAHRSSYATTSVNHESFYMVPMAVGRVKQMFGATV